MKSLRFIQSIYEKSGGNLSREGKQGKVKRIEHLPYDLTISCLSWLHSTRHDLLRIMTHLYSSLILEPLAEDHGRLPLSSSDL